MTGYQAVQDALSGGADPSMLCATCPWDRNCVSPPDMTRADIDAAIERGEKIDEDAALKRGENPGTSMPLATLMTTMMFAGRENQAQVCPVFALRLRSSGGRQIADSVRASMQSWDDQAVTS